MVFLTKITQKIYHLNVGHIEKFLRYFDQSVQFEETLSSVETACEVEYAGCKLYKYIQILVKVE